MSKRRQASSQDARAIWTQRVKALLEGRTIKRAEYLSKDECDQLAWGQAGVVVELDNGLALFVASDDEGNAPGALHTTDKQTPILPVIPA